MRRTFLLIYAIIITAVTIGFLIFGENKDPRFYVTILMLAIVEKIVSTKMEN